MIAADLSEKDVIKQSRSKSDVPLDCLILGELLGILYLLSEKIILHLCKVLKIQRQVFDRS